MQRAGRIKTTLLRSLALLTAALVVGLILVTAAWVDPFFTQAEKQEIAALSLASLPPIPADPSNEAIDNPTAMALGATLFFDMRMSRNGAVSCSICHQIGRQFQDGLPLGQGMGTMNRRTQPLAGVAWERSFFWDGRKDSLWSQALAPLEKDVEHGLTRAFYARFMEANFRDRYERVFGPMPDLSRVPANAGPLGSPAEQAAWTAMGAADREAVDEVFVNTGKLIAAFERSIVHQETRFDRFAAALGRGEEPEGDAVLTPQEIAGIRLFVGPGKCVTCHGGPRFSDGEFHNTGVPPVEGLPEDLGRATGLAQLLADEFNCLRFNAKQAACGSSRTENDKNPKLIRAYKAPSLRGVAARPPFMHAGQFATLDAVLDHYSAAPASLSGQSELKPLNFSDEEKRELVAFLRTLGP